MLTLLTHFSTLVPQLLSNNTPSVVLFRLFKVRVHLVQELPLHHGTNHPNGMITHHKFHIIPDFVKHSSMPIEHECPLLNEISFNAYPPVVTHSPLFVTINLSPHNEAHRSIVIPILTFTRHGYKSIITAPTPINGSVIQTQKP